MGQGSVRRSRATLAFVVAIVIVVGAVSAGMWRASGAAAAGGSQSAALLREIDAYREAAGKLDPRNAANRWLALYDRASQLAAPARGPEIDEFDPVSEEVAGPLSMFAALPPPEAWPHLRAAVDARAAADSGRATLGLRYFTAMLVEDREAAGQALDALETLVVDSSDERSKLRDSIREARALLGRLYGTVDERIAALMHSLSVPSDYPTVVIPDLVAMVGEGRAAELLSGVIASAQMLRVEGGRETAALLRRLALENIASMKVAQWNLALSMDAAPLYEAIDARFAARRQADDETADDWERGDAMAYYFLACVRDGRHAQAEQVLGQLARNGEVAVPREAIAALQRAGLNEPLYRFLERVLEKQPGTDAWDVYFEQAAYTGHAADALALVDRLLARRDQPRDLVDALRMRRIAALLAADRIAAAAEDWRVLLAAGTEKSERHLRARLHSAVNAAAVGRLAGDDELRKLGADFALRAARLTVAEDADEAFAELGPVIAELRRQGRAHDARVLVDDILARKPSFMQALAARSTGRRGDESRRALVELVSIHFDAGRHREALGVLAESPRWGASDLGELLELTDARDVPLGAMVAGSLAATGDSRGALRVAHATAAALPKRDAPYELVVKLDPDAPAVLESWYARDEFEERPLIWAAAALLERGRLAEAEHTVRRAIAIDPSDGEEGPNDRMRAYAILAQVLERRGDEDARVFAGAVAAIRQSEHADALHAAGLYERAFAEYRAALEKFSDAYCIQSRLAVQLSRQGRQREALEHYRRAYELMPDSFGRVESHCFGCESVFADAQSQSLAERLFTEMIRKNPGKAQAHYLLAYLREQQGSHSAAVQPLRVAVGIDGHYLNAWKRLDDIADKTYLDPGERDVARLKLLELDPLQRHSRYRLDEVGALAQLYRGAARAWEKSVARAGSSAGVLPLPASAAAQARLAAEDPAQAQLRARFRAIESRHGPGIDPPHVVMFEHVLVANAIDLVGARRDYWLQ
jgi:tetratricopeptide (TPR) repeat protein